MERPKRDEVEQDKLRGREPLLWEKQVVGRLLLRQRHKRRERRTSVDVDEVKTALLDVYTYTYICKGQNIDSIKTSVEQKTDHNSLPLLHFWTKRPILSKKTKYIGGTSTSKFSFPTVKGEVGYGKIPFSMKKGEGTRKLVIIVRSLMILPTADTMARCREAIKVASQIALGSRVTQEGLL